jgi:catechol 2,3-dioxygenase-like lactoylglutathione lyase family enzyme
MEIQPEITRDIYGMPAFVTFYVSDLDRTIDWYVNGLGFISLFTVPGPDGGTALVHLRRWRYQDILVQPGRSSVGVSDSMGSTVDTAVGEPSDRGFGRGQDWTWSVMAEAEELDSLADRARAHGGGSVDGPVDTPWNTRDLRTIDPDGNVVVFTARRPEGQRDEAFSARIQEMFRAQRAS